MHEALDIHVIGIVQGVGFRPFVYRIASTHNICGWVLNATDGVHIHAEASSDDLDAFVMEISENAPAAARVERIKMDEVPVEGFGDFPIRFSDDVDSNATTLVSPDLATCDDCLAELFDPANRRYHYPFINCTNCGPRFTIMRALPYDRPQTSMSEFPMCPDCAHEYADPADRRFHAQPDACFDCGPRLCFVDLTQQGEAKSQLLGTHAFQKGQLGDGEALWATNVGESDALIDAVVSLLKAGSIVAVKGLGGFHLVCDASNPVALANLRKRKRREGKAFACMVASVEDARAFCLVSEEEERLLASPARPIVLLKKKPSVQLAAGLADGLTELGLMLPATPLQHLIVRAFSGMLVMTSGNVHDEPIQTDDAQAVSALAGIADALLGNNRAILSRYDDSVLRVLSVGEGQTAVQFIRRARGFAPLPIALPARPEGATGQDACLFATGPEQKNTFCYTRPGEAFVSQHIGDMENVATNDAWLEAKGAYASLLRLDPVAVACDKHPEYLTSKWASGQDLPVTAVQHHHAHIVSAMAENGLEGPVCGIAFDGTGYGEDGAIWGGEVLMANLATFERLANFAYIPLPGGAAAIKHPMRCAYGALWAFDLLEHPAAKGLLDAMGDEAEICDQMIERGLNTPYTSSVGRLFDAASALLGVCAQPTYEGEGAVLLEAAIDHAAQADAEAAAAYRVEVVKNTATENSTALDTSVVLFDAAPLFKAMLDDMAAGVSVGVIARRFHDAMVEVIVMSAQLAEAAYGVRTVVLSGGVFMNRYLMEHAVPALGALGYTAAMNKDLPPNDACISYGQAVVALRTIDTLPAGE